MSQQEATKQVENKEPEEKEKEKESTSTQQPQPTDINKVSENEPQNISQSQLETQTVSLSLDNEEKENENDESNATRKVMKSLSGCLINEIQSSRIDYSLLRELNNKSALEYIDMTQRAKLLLSSMNVMNEQESKLMEELTKIDDLVEEVNKLDSVVRKLDEYTKNLHAQFHKLYSTK